VAFGICFLPLFSCVLQRVCCPEKDDYSYLAPKNGLAQNLVAPSGVEPEEQALSGTKQSYRGSYEEHGSWHRMDPVSFDFLPERNGTIEVAGVGHDDDGDYQLSGIVRGRHMDLQKRYQQGPGPQGSAGHLVSIHLTYCRYPKRLTSGTYSVVVDDDLASSIQSMVELWGQGWFGHYTVGRTQQCGMWYIVPERDTYSEASSLMRSPPHAGLRTLASKMKPRTATCENACDYLPHVQVVIMELLSLCALAAVIWVVNGSVEDYMPYEDNLFASFVAGGLPIIMSALAMQFLSLLVNPAFWGGGSHDTTAGWIWAGSKVCCVALIMAQGIPECMVYWFLALEDSASYSALPVLNQTVGSTLRAVDFYLRYQVASDVAAFDKSFQCVSYSGSPLEHQDQSCLNQFEVYRITYGPKDGASCATLKDQLTLVFLIRFALLLGAFLFNFVAGCIWMVASMRARQRHCIKQVVYSPFDALIACNSRDPVHGSVEGSGSYGAMEQGAGNGESDEEVQLHNLNV